MAEPARNDQTNTTPSNTNDWQRQQAYVVDKQYRDDLSGAELALLHDVAAANNAHTAGLIRKNQRLARSRTTAQQAQANVAPIESRRRHRAAAQNKAQNKNQTTPTQNKTAKGASAGKINRNLRRPNNVQKTKRPAGGRSGGLGRGRRGRGRAGALKAQAKKPKTTAATAKNQQASEVKKRAEERSKWLLPIGWVVAGIVGIFNTLFMYFYAAYDFVAENSTIVGTAKAVGKTAVGAVTRDAEMVREGLLALGYIFDSDSFIGLMTIFYFTGSLFALLLSK